MQSHRPLRRARDEAEPHQWRLELENHELGLLRRDGTGPVSATLPASIHDHGVGFGSVETVSHGQHRWRTAAAISCRARSDTSGLHLMGLGLFDDSSGDTEDHHR
jgi:hypothetical protein